MHTRVLEIDEEREQISATSSFKLKRHNQDVGKKIPAKDINIHTNPQAISKS